MGIMDVLEELNDWAPEEEQQTPELETIEAEVVEVLEETAAVEEPEDLVEIPEQMEPLEGYSDAPCRQRPPFRVRPEWILGAIALIAALVLGIVLWISMPYFGGKSEDPEVLPQRHPEAFEVTQALQETILEPSTSETEPVNPTIPPDRNPYDRYDFQYDRHNYLLLQNAESWPGVDVSAYQGKIDWHQVKASGIRFAMIRLGYRGYESGKLVTDEYAKENLKGAKEAGLKVGAYFFSQALSIQETDQEIDYMLKILGDTKLDMPIVLDWEIPAASARTVNMDKLTLTDIQRHFCGQMRDKGYQPMIYFNWSQSEKLYSLHDLEEYPFWLALYQDRMTYPWKVEMWQWTDKGKVPGIKGPVDLNVYMPY